MFAESLDLNGYDTVPVLPPLLDQDQGLLPHLGLLLLPPVPSVSFHRRTNPHGGPVTVPDLQY
jgi:hypothetical protein